jgi:hypothetical protein
VTEGQKGAIAQLSAMAEDSHGKLVVGKWLEPDECKSLVVPIVLDCRGFTVADGGLPLRESEKFYLWIGPDFPFSCPGVSVDHERFAGQAHVQWKHSLCLYLSPSTDWNPQRGMFGLLERLEVFLEVRAGGKEELGDAPMHPPVAYLGRDWERVISSANTPVVSKTAWGGSATLVRAPSGLWEISGYGSMVAASETQLNAAVFLLPIRLPFEFPTTLEGLIDHLVGSGIDERTFKRALGKAAEANGPDTQLYVIIGTPSRAGASGGIIQNLAIWKISAEEANYVRLLQLPKNPTDRLKELVVQAGPTVWRLIGGKVNWCRVMEARPEAVIRRDADTVGDMVIGRRIAIWGAGALGAPIALWAAKMGAKSIRIYDNKVVSPGLVVRQPYRKADIGLAKARCLAAQLKVFDDSIDVSGHVANVVDLLGTDGWHKDLDLIIDATANLAVLQKTETVRRDSVTRGVPIISVGVGPSCENGIVRVADAGSREGPWATDRRAKLEMSSEDLRHFDLLWPEASDGLFQPEPGCGDPTFRGSASECAAMAGTLLNLGLQLLSKLDGNHRSAFAVTGQQGHGFATRQRILENPKVISDSMSPGREVFIPRAVLATMDLEMQQMAKKAEDIETGGVILGEWCHLSNRIYVDRVTGPPVDSICSKDEFQCGIDGVDELSLKAQIETRGSCQLVGIWHSHPKGSANQSGTDFATMSDAVRQARPSTRQFLMLIRGKGIKEIAAYGYTRKEVEELGAGRILVYVMFPGMGAGRGPKSRRNGKPLISR